MNGSPEPTLLVSSACRSAMSARAEVVAARDEHGATVLRELRSHAPIGLRSAPDLAPAAGGAGVRLVGAAAGPIGGDSVAVDVRVERGACLVVRSVAASIVLPGNGGAMSRTITRIDVADDASIDWWTEPMVTVVGSRHLADTTITLGHRSSVRLREELQLGRTGEAPGHVVSRLRVERRGVPVVHHEVCLGEGEPGWGGPGGIAGARAFVSELRVGPEWDADALASTPVEVTTPVAAGWLRLDEDAVLGMSLGPDLLTACRSLAQGCEDDPP